MGPHVNFQFTPSNNQPNYASFQNFSLHNLNNNNSNNSNPLFSSFNLNQSSKNPPIPHTSSYSNNMGSDSLEAADNFFNNNNTAPNLINYSIPNNSNTKLNNNRQQLMDNNINKMIVDISLSKTNAPPAAPFQYNNPAAPFNTIPQQFSNYSNNEIMDKSHFIPHVKEEKKPQNDNNKMSKLKKSKRSKSMEGEDHNIRISQTDREGEVVKKRFLWSKELHEQFVSACKELKDPNMMPKNILSTMKSLFAKSADIERKKKIAQQIHILTLGNIASHLQKYRLFLKKKGLDINTSPLIDDGMMDNCSKGLLLLFFFLFIISILMNNFFLIIKIKGKKENIYVIVMTMKMKEENIFHHQLQTQEMALLQILLLLPLLKEMKRMNKCLSRIKASFPSMLIIIIILVLKFLQISLQIIKCVLIANMMQIFMQLYKITLK